MKSDPHLPQVKLRVLSIEKSSHFLNQSSMNISNPTDRLFLKIGQSYKRLSRKSPWLKRIFLTNILSRNQFLSFNDSLIFTSVCTEECYTQYWIDGNFWKYDLWAKNLSLVGRRVFHLSSVSQTSTSQDLECTFRFKGKRLWWRSECKVLSSFSWPFWLIFH